jgi:SAM-dependent methyltransferase
MRWAELAQASPLQRILYDGSTAINNSKKITKPEKTLNNSSQKTTGIFARLVDQLKGIFIDMGRFYWNPEQIQQSSKRLIRIHLFLTSFLILFFELAIIRWIPAHVRYLGFFMNFMLLAVFLGIGVGILSGRRPGLWLPPFPVLWFVLLYMVAQFHFVLSFPTTEVLYFGVAQSAAGNENFLILPLIFTLVAVTVTPLGRSLGGLLTGLPSLEAYAIDILGSLTGIATFFAFSYFSLQPIVWFGLAVGLYLLLSRPKEWVISLPLILGIFYIVSWLDIDSVWSPYYLIRVGPNSMGGYDISVNNVGHQDVRANLNERENFYFRVYDLFAPRKFSNVLILGAGSGSDVAIALQEGAQRVDAVEIDPRIYQYGVELNPARPYQDPRVDIVIDDGRAFLRNSKERYDLIIFALPDSLTLTSGFSSIRLESFLLTTEAMEEARHLLAANGVVVLYNYYREDWLIYKLAYMLQTAFGEAPYVTTYGLLGKAAVLIAGNNLSEINPQLTEPYTNNVSNQSLGRGIPLPLIGAGRLTNTSSLELARDDWPFIYQQHRSLPGIFLLAILTVLIISIIMLGLAVTPKIIFSLKWHFFFLGVAFMLLETRSLVTFSLLFGSTWMVNSLVFFAILSSVLLAILINYKYELKNLKLLYGLLALSLLINYIIPLKTLLALENPVLRYALAGTLTFAPVFLANLVFSQAFRETETSDIAFGSNLLGAMLGGLLEYLSLLLGYQALLIVALAAYLLAYTFAKRKALKV